MNTLTRKWVALRHIPSGLYFGDSEKYPVSSRYGQYCDEVAAKRRANMEHPEEWEIVIAPFQGNWED